MEKTENIALKLGIVGNTAVGKTTLILRVADDKFYDNTSAGIALDFRTIRNYEVNKKLYNLLIYDIAGQAKNSDLAISFIKDASSLILAFSIPDQEYYANNQEINISDNTREQQSLQQQLIYWMQKIHEVANEKVSVLIVGCQRDKVKDERIFSLINTEIEKTIKDLQPNITLNIVYNTDKNLVFFPTSSLTGEGVQELFKIWTLQASKLILKNGSQLVNQVKDSKKQKNSKDCC